MEERFPGVKKVALVGVFADKDYNGVLQATLGAADKAFTFDWDNKRDLSGKKLQECASKLCDTKYIPNIKDALTAALEAAGDGIVMAYGSFSHLKIIKSEYEKLTKRSL